MRKNLKGKRESTGFTQDEAARRVGIKPRQYKALEAGTSNGSVKVWKELKRLLDAPTIDHLLEQVEEPRDRPRQP